eukprot:5671539-Amphidinium_carterae.1
MDVAPRNLESHLLTTVEPYACSHKSLFVQPHFAVQPQQSATCPNSSYSECNHRLGVFMFVDCPRCTGDASSVAMACGSSDNPRVLIPSCGALLAARHKVAAFY